MSMPEPVSLIQVASAPEKKVYAGVGSRDTPPDVLELMKAFARQMNSAGWTLRSGAALGADTAFEQGAGRGRKEIYLPFLNFNGSRAEFKPLTEECYERAKAVHPAWERCTSFARQAHARNVRQVLGADLNAPASLLVCWTKDGATGEENCQNAGGTRTAIVLAQRAGIPVFNLRRPEHRMQMVGFLAFRNEETAEPDIQRSRFGKLKF